MRGNYRKIIFCLAIFFSVFGNLFILTQRANANLEETEISTVAATLSVVESVTPSSDVDDQFIDISFQETPTVEPNNNNGQILTDIDPLVTPTMPPDEAFSSPSTVSLDPVFETASPNSSNPNEVGTNSPDASSKDIIVKFDQSVDPATILNSFNYISSYFVISELNSVVISLSTADEQKFLNDDAIEMASITPSDPNFYYQNYLDNINAPNAWAYNTGASTVTIAVLDTGVDLNHQDLIGKILPGYDFVNNDAIAQDDNGHGTEVAGVAAAASNNGIGITGISWGAQILPVKVLNSNGNGSYATLAEGIIWAVNHGADVINLSLGGSGTSQTLQNAIDYALGNNVVVVAASGNNGGNVLYPACINNVIAVGSTDDNNNHASFSNTGSSLDVTAPGMNIFTTALNGNYTYASGTSLSTPQVSGLAAILLGINKFLSIDEITSVITSTALDLGQSGWDSLFGWGLIQLDTAIQQVSVTPLPTTFFTPTLTTTKNNSPKDSQSYMPSSTPSPQNNQNPKGLFTATPNFDLTPQKIVPTNLVNIYTIGMESLSFSNNPSSNQVNGENGLLIDPHETTSYGKRSLDNTFNEENRSRTLTIVLKTIIPLVIGLFLLLLFVVVKKIPL